MANVKYIRILYSFLKKGFRDFWEIRAYSKFFKNIKYPEPHRGKILMYTGIPMMYMTPFEILLYHLLKLKGYDVHYCIYDENIRINELITNKIVTAGQARKFWKRVISDGTRRLIASKVEYKTIVANEEVAKLLTSLDGDVSTYFNYEYDGIHFGKIVEGTVFRFFKSLSLGSDSSEVARQVLETSLINYFFAKELTAQNKYEYVFCSHGIYCTWEPVILHFKNLGISQICYDRGKKKNTININLNRPAPNWDISEAWSRLENYTLSSTENEQVDAYYAQRELQKNDVYSYNAKKKSADLDLLRNELGINKDAKVITIFTNLIWDAANIARDIAFESPLRCIEQTINRYLDTQNIHIIVRSHPAESVLGTDQGYCALVKEMFDEIPANVSLIEPEQKINSFSIIDISDIGIVHTSTVGLEMAMSGKPVILISDTHYRDKGFTFDAENENHYFELLDSFLQKSVDMRMIVHLARKYFYLMMFEYQHDVPILYNKDNSFSGFTHANIKSLIDQEEERIIKIVDRVSSNAEYDDFIFR
jgi:hypothetical protein